MFAVVVGAKVGLRHVRLLLVSKKHLRRDAAVLSGFFTSAKVDLNVTRPMFRFEQYGGDVVHGIADLCIFHIAFTVAWIRFRHFRKLCKHDVLYFFAHGDLLWGMRKPPFKGRFHVIYQRFQMILAERGSLHQAQS